MPLFTGLIILALGLPGAPARADESNCEDFLPSAPPVAIPADDQTMSWTIPGGRGLPPSWHYEVTDPVSGDHYVATYDGGEPDENEPITLGGTPDTLTVDLTGWHLPHDEPIYYFVRADFEGATCEANGLALMITEQNPSSIQALGETIVENYYVVAGNVFNYAAGRLGRAGLTARDDILDLCRDVWGDNDFASACYWAPGYSSTVVGKPKGLLNTGSAVRETDAIFALDRFRGSQGAGTHHYCKTKREYGNWAGNFYANGPDIVTLGTATSVAEPAWGYGRIYLYGDVTRASQGGARVETAGAAGYEETVDFLGINKPGAGPNLEIDAALVYSITGENRAAAWGATDLAGDGTGRASIEVTSHSGNVSDNNWTNGGLVAEDHQESSFGFIPWDWANSHVNEYTVANLPRVTVNDKDVARWTVRAEAVAEAEAFLAGSAAATTEFGPRNSGETSTNYIAANSVDLTLINSNWWWRVPNEVSCY